MAQLEPGERLDDLQYRNLSLIQAPGLAFSADSVLLAAYCRIRRGERAIDLGCGSGVLCTLLTARCGAAFTAVDVNEAACERLMRSAAHNGQGIEVHCMDWRDAPQQLGSGAFRAAVCNPPYFGTNGSPSPDTERALARQGSGLAGMLESAARLLCNGGRLFFCYPVDALADALALSRGAGLEPKRLQLVEARAGKPPYLALIEAKKGGKPGLVMEPVLAITDAAGNQTPAIREIYHMNESVPGTGPV